MKGARTVSGSIASVDEGPLKADIGNLVRKTVEETLNAPLDEEAAELVGAARYERAAGREAYRSGHYGRKLVTGAGVAGLGAPSSGRDVPDGHHMKYVADHEWGKRRHLDMTKLEEMDERKRENKG